jgi:hypothetical protein
VRRGLLAIKGGGDVIRIGQVWHDTKSRILKKMKIVSVRSTHKVLWSVDAHQSAGAGTVRIQGNFILNLSEKIVES